MSQRWVLAAAPLLVAGCTLVDLDGLSSGGGASATATGTSGTTLPGPTGATTTASSSSTTSASSGLDCGALVACDAQCVDVDSSVQHCGRCDRDCEGGACIDGECQPVLLFAAGNGAQATGVALSDTEVVWNGQPDVRALPKNAAPGDQPRRLTNVRGARIAVEGNEAYLSGEPMVRIDLATGMETQVFSGFDCETEVQLAGGFVYCSDFDAGVHRVRPDGTGHEVIVATTNHYTGIFARDSGVYFRGPVGEIQMLPTDLSGSPVTVFSAEGVDGNFTVLGNTLYALGATSLWQVDLVSGITEAALTNTNHYGMSAGDARAVYITQWNTNLVRRKSLDGSPDATFFTTAMHTDVVAIDDHYVFFTDYAGNGLYRMVR